MTKRIFKYPLFTSGMTCKIRMPRGAKICTVQMQGEAVCMWAEVDYSAPLEDRTFVVVGTGHDVPDNCVYVGTWQHAAYVWHAYEEITVQP